MKAFLARLGVTPVWLAGWLVLATGLLWLNWLVNNTWPVSVHLSQAEFDDLKRAVVTGRLDAAGLLENSNPEAVLAFLGGVLAAMAGLVMPLVYFINRRFRPRSTLPPSQLVIVPFKLVARQSLWFGVWASVCAYLQMQRALGLAVALLIAAILGLIEGMLLVRARAVAEQSVARQTGGEA